MQTFKKYRKARFVSDTSVSLWGQCSAIVDDNMLDEVQKNQALNNLRAEVINRNGFYSGQRRIVDDFIAKHTRATRSA